MLGILIVKTYQHCMHGILTLLSSSPDFWFSLCFCVSLGQTYSLLPLSIQLMQVGCSGGFSSLCGQFTGKQGRIKSAINKTHLLRYLRVSCSRAAPSGLCSGPHNIFQITKMARVLLHWGWGSSLSFLLTYHIIRSPHHQATWPRFGASLLGTALVGERTNRKVSLR